MSYQQPAEKERPDHMTDMSLCHWCLAEDKDKWETVGVSEDNSMRTPQYNSTACVDGSVSQ